ncbi:MAG: hypothetical protein EXR11_14435 [Rhodospirillaceae bacterium]|nr:hypothetical protein [Rhodospirillaceae bacterium]
MVKLVSLPDPEPGPGEIVIRMEAAAVHIADLKNFTGERIFAAKPLPRIPGYEGVGRVARLGAGVTQFKVGERVFPWWSAGTFAERVATATRGASVKLGLDMVAGAATGRLMHCMADGGVVVNYGVMSGEPCTVPFSQMYHKDVTLKGMSAMHGMAKRNMAELRTIYSRLAAMIATGQLRAAIAGTYSISEYGEAFQHAGRTGAERDGKVIFTFDP